MLFSLCLGAFCVYIIFCLVNEYDEYGLPFELGFFRAKTSGCCSSPIFRGWDSFDIHQVLNIYKCVKWVLRLFSKYRYVDPECGEISCFPKLDIEHFC